MKVSNSKHNHRLTRDGILSKTHTLRVFGSQKMGFRLGGQRNNVVQLFGQKHKKQTDAIAYGEKKFNVKAVKLVKA